MGAPPDNVITLSSTLSICEFQNPKNGKFGFWLYDNTRGLNLAMRATTERDAFAKALTYYQDLLTKVERDYATLSAKVNIFIDQFTEEEN